jgi:hypothetical protein
MVAVYSIYTFICHYAGKFEPLCIRIGAVMGVIISLLDLLLPRQSVLVTTKAVSLNPAHG